MYNQLGWFYSDWQGSSSEICVQNHSPKHHNVWKDNANSFPLLNFSIIYCFLCENLCDNQMQSFSKFIIWTRQTMYEDRLISNAHSEIFCQGSKVAMCAQCVLVATTLLHSGAKFHSFLYTGSKTVHVNMESCYGGKSTRLKQRAVTEFLSAENVRPAEIHRRLQAV